MMTTTTKSNTETGKTESVCTKPYGLTLRHLVEFNDALLRERANGYLIAIGLVPRGREIHWNYVNLTALGELADMELHLCMDGK